MGIIAHRVTRLFNVITIRRPPATVFDHITTPATWTAWVPITLGVAGATDHPLVVGERLTEVFSEAGVWDTIAWEVRHRFAPHSWRIEGESKTGFRSTISYTLAETPDGTRYEREWCYWGLGPVLLPWWDWIYARRRMGRYSEEALQRLKGQLEAA